MTLMVLSRFASRSAASKPSATSARIALDFSGRLRVIVAIGPGVAYLTNSSAIDALVDDGGQLAVEMADRTLEETELEVLARVGGQAALDGGHDGAVLLGALGGEGLLL